MKNQEKIYHGHVDDGNTLMHGKAKHEVWIKVDNLNNMLTGKRLEWIPLLPNARDFRINVIKEAKTLGGKGKSVTDYLWFQPYHNKRLNKYWLHQLRRLTCNRYSNHALFWRIAWSLVTRSKTFALIHLQRVEPKWYKNYPLHYIVRTLHKLREISKGPKHIEINRVYIPKDKQLDKWRPLGVPMLAWRIWLSMLNTILVIYLEKWWHPNQHGYYPGKGVMSAWEDITRNVLLAENIYEFDFKQFFPTVKIKAINTILRKYGVPEEILGTLWELMMSQPKLKPRHKVHDKVDESRIRDQAAGLKIREILGKTETRRLASDAEWAAPRNAHEWKELERTIWNRHVDRLGEWRNNKEAMHVFEWWAREQNMYQICLKDFDMQVMMQTEEYKNLSNFHKLNLYTGWQRDIMKLTERANNIPRIAALRLQGVEQGTPIAPVLSVLPLMVWQDKYQTVVYADDGLIYGSHESILRAKADPLLERIGATIHPDKSGWVKKEGKWLKELKFLGLIYNGVDRTLRSARRGKPEGEKKTLEQMQELVEEWGLERVRGDSQSELFFEDWKIDSWEDLIWSDAAGWVLADMWNPGTFDKILEQREFNWRFDSMVPKLRRRVKGRIHLYNCSSYAYCHLLRIWRKSEKKRMKSSA